MAQRRIGAKGGNEGFLRGRKPEEKPELAGGVHPFVGVVEAVPMISVTKLSRYQKIERSTRRSL